MLVFRAICVVLCRFRNKKKDVVKSRRQKDQTAELLRILENEDRREN